MDKLFRRLQRTILVALRPFLELFGIALGEFSEASARAGGAERRGSTVTDSANVYLRGLRNQLLRVVIFPALIILLGIITASSWVIFLAVLYWVYIAVRMFLIGSPLGFAAQYTTSANRNVREAATGYVKVAGTVILAGIALGLYLMLFATGIRANLTLLPWAAFALLLAFLAPGLLRNIGIAVFAIVTVMFLASTDYSRVPVVNEAVEAREAAEAREQAREAAEANAIAAARAQRQREREIFNDPWVLYATDTGSETPVWITHTPGSNELSYTYSFTRDGATHVVEGECDRISPDRFDCEWEQQTSRDQSTDGELTLIRENERLFSGFETYIGQSARTTGVTPIYLAHSADALASVR